MLGPGYPRAERPDAQIHMAATEAGCADSSDYTMRPGAEAAVGRFKRVIGDGLRSRTGQRRATEVWVAVHPLNRMLELGHPISVRIA